MEQLFQVCVGVKFYPPNTHKTHTNLPTRYWLRRMHDWCLVSWMDLRWVYNDFLVLLTRWEKSECSALDGDLHSYLRSCHTSQYPAQTRRKGRLRNNIIIIITFSIPLEHLKRFFRTSLGPLSQENILPQENQLTKNRAETSARHFFFG